jgi:hypothetical protein
MMREPMKPDPITRVDGSSPRGDATRPDPCTHGIIRTSVLSPGVTQSALSRLLSSLFAVTSSGLLATLHA